MNIHFSRATYRWLKRFEVCSKSLRKIILHLTYKEGIPTNNNLFIHIMHNGINSEYDIIGNKIRVGIDISKTSSKDRIVKRMVRNLLHELRHFIQYKIQKRKPEFTYSYRDMLYRTNKYWNAPEERDARKYERKKLSLAMKYLERIK